MVHTVFVHSCKVSPFEYGFVSTSKAEPDAAYAGNLPHPRHPGVKSMTDVSSEHQMLYYVQVKIQYSARVRVTLALVHFRGREAQ
jgi:hypothetical protein